jgi:hypothetical protein
MMASTLVRPLRGRTLGLLLGLCTVLPYAGLARAQTEEDRANARAAAGAGADAFDAGNFQKSADYFERAESLVHSPVHQWYISRSVKELGQLVKARELCMRVVREGTKGASSGVLAANDGCEDILKELEGRIPALTIDVVGLESGTKYTVKRNGVDVSLAVIGIPAPVDPGEYTVTGAADGFFAEEQKVALTEGGQATVTLTFQAGSPAVVPVAATAAVADPEEPAPAEEGASPEAEKSGSAAPPVASYILWGGGLGAIAFGVVMGLDSKAQADRVVELCGGNPAQCMVDEGSSEADEITNLNNQSGTSQILSIVGYGVGGAAIATGVVLWVVQMNKGKKATATHVEPRLQPVVGFGHVGLAGTF